VRLEEAIEHGQHIANYRIDTWQDGAWKPLTWGTTIGHRKLDRVPLTRTARMRVVIEHAYDMPRLSRVALHRMPGAQT
jgi:alpha-L-fucosidase